MARQSTLPDSSRYTVEVGARGQLVLPTAVRERLSLTAGDRFVLSLEPDGSMRLVSLREQVKKVQGLFSEVAPGVDLAEELIRERRQETRREKRG